MKNENRKQFKKDFSFKKRFKVYLKFILKLWYLFIPLIFSLFMILRVLVLPESFFVDFSSKSLFISGMLLYLLFNVFYELFYNKFSSLINEHLILIYEGDENVNE